MARTADAGETTTGLWIVQLAEPSLASFGGAAGVAATSPRVTGERALDVSTQTSVAYLRHLEEEQTEAATRIEQRLGREVDVAFEYRNVLNGLAVEISLTEAQAVAALPGVAAVYEDVERHIDTDASHRLLRSSAIWQGGTGSGVATRGEGIIVGLLDTGINPFHPSFAATEGQGFTHTNPFGSGNFVGVCDPAHPQHDPICNDKLIGAWSFNPTSGSARDGSGHGSHVASTMAGNIHQATFTLGSNTEITRTVQGVASRANIISYLVCRPGCPSSASVAAIDQAIADGVDVLNYSIAGTDDPWNDPVELAFLEALEAGIFVSASAGNIGPGAGTVSHTAPWNASVAATTHERVFAHEVDVTGPEPVPPGLTGLPGVPGDGPLVTADIQAQVRDARVLMPVNGSGCAPFPSGTFTGAIALMDGAFCPFGQKVENAQAAGAVAVVLVNPVVGPPRPVDGVATTSIPALMLSSTDGAALRTYMATSAPTATSLRISADTGVALDETWADMLGWFSSRGPSQFDLLAPTYAAPGLNILAATTGPADDPARYAVLHGTSMASPHGAGAAALMTDLFPDLTPVEVRSALAGGADHATLVKEDGVTPAEPFDIGSGRLNLDRSGRIGLVMDETAANFRAANPDLGGDPRTLNVPSIIDHECVETCTFTRTVKNVALTSATYTAQIDPPTGMTVTVTPDTFTLDRGETREIEVSVDVAGLTVGDWAYGRFGFSTTDQNPTGAIADVSYPIAVTPATALPGFALEPAELTSTQAPDEVSEQTLTIGNTGTANLEWVALDGFPNAPVTVTHSVSQRIVAGNSATCTQDGGQTTRGHASLRVFDLDRLGVPGLDITEVTFGVERSTIPVSVGVSIFTMRDLDGPLTYANLALLARADHEVPAGAHMVTVPVSASASPQATIVVEVDVPDLHGEASFFIGSNPDGQGSPSYIRASACGIHQPTDLATIGAPDMHIVMNVTGTPAADACAVPATVSWIDIDPASGTVQPRGEQEVAVTIDSTGLARASYTGSLCLETNDPGAPITIVPVTLTVEGEPVIEVTPQAYAVSQEAGTVTEHELSIRNIGNVMLDWSITQTGLEVSGTGVTAGHRAQLPPTNVPPARVGSASVGLSEGFEDISTLPEAGWAMINNSQPSGVKTWMQGSTTTFPAHEGEHEEYIMVQYESTAGVGTISNWLLTPELPLQPGAALSFWTRVPAGTEWPDRLELRLSTSGDSTDVGTSALSVGDFTTLLLTVNPDLAVDGYPAVWTQFTAKLGDVPAGTTGRFAFRYFVTDGGPGGNNSNLIGIDTVAHTPGGPCDSPVDIPWLTVAPSRGSTARGDTSGVIVSVDAGGLEPGSYDAQLCVDSNDPETPRVIVPVAVSVTDPTCFGLEPTIVGTGGGVINGTSRADVILVDDADYTINGGAGDDLICTGDGDNTINGGAGHDRILTGDGNNHVNAGAGNDEVTTGSGDDVIDGGAGHDTIDAGDGNNLVRGHAGNDTITAGSGDDVIYGAAGNDVIRAGGGEDMVFGDAGNDRIYGEDGDDDLFGGPGNDIIDGGAGRNRIDGGPGRDTCSNGSTASCEVVP